MTIKAVLTGPIEAIDAALSGEVDWAGLEPHAAAVVGGGEPAVPVVARAPAWEALDFEGLSGAVIVLAAPPPSVSTTRLVLARAAERRLRAFIIEAGRARALTLDDLVGKPLRDLDWARIREQIVGRRVLITGGGGSIGAELARRVMGLEPRQLTILDNSEYNLFKIGLELADARSVLADVRDAVAMRRWFERTQPDIVFHAAALKQVPLVEEFPSEGVLTNVCGTRNVADAARAVGADLIYVSTDKAVEPSGAMGASKRLGELYCQALDRRGAQRALPVRLGNVLGSAGSVAPLFNEQFASGGPLTVTDPAITRYFLSIPQAADVLLQAAAIGLRNNEARGATFVVEMGEALPVVELARDVIRLGGQRPDEDMSVVFVGLRPGEKLHERLIGEDEACVPSGAQGVLAAASPERGLAELRELIERLAGLARQGADEAVVAEMFSALAMPAPQRRRAANA